MELAIAQMVLGISVSIIGVKVFEKSLQVFASLEMSDIISEAPSEECNR